MKKWQSTVTTICKIAAIIGPVCIMMLLAWTPGISFTEDLGRHLLLGQIITETRSVPDTNLLTYTCPDYPFVNHHWLSEVGLYWIHHYIGLSGLILVKMAMMGLALALAMCTILPKRGWWFYWLMGVLAAIMMGFRAHIRPELVTYLCVACYLFLFERVRNGHDWVRWLIVPVALVWANAHIYFIFGIGMVLAFALESVWVNSGKKNVVKQGVWFLAVLLISCVNPNGISGFLYPFKIFSNYGVAITENASPLEYWQTVVNPMLLALPFLTVCVGMSLLIIIVRYLWKHDRAAVRLANSIIVIAAMIATWKMARSAPLLALTAMPLVASIFSGKRAAPGVEAPLEAEQEMPVQTHKNYGYYPRLVMNVIMLLLTGLLVVTIVLGSYGRIFPSPISPTPFGFDDEARYQRLIHLAEDYGLKGPVFTDYNLGSLVEYELYPQPGYVDNRPEAFPVEFWRAEYYPALALTERWDQVRDARKINAIIVSLPGVKEVFCQELMRRPQWVLVHLDELCAVWVRNSVDNKTIIDAKVFDSEQLTIYKQEIQDTLKALSGALPWEKQHLADVIVYRLYGLVCIGQVQEVWPYLKQLYEYYPDYQIVHELMRISVPQDEVDVVKNIMKKRARWPLAAKQVTDWAYYLIGQGRIDEAEKVLRRGHRFFPLSPTINTAIAQIEDQHYLEQHL